MIVVTVGTHEQPFDRLLRAVAGLEGDEPLVVQYGSAQPPHGRGEWVDYLSFDELADLAAKARVFVCHAGVGSIVLARRCGHRPIIVPRRRQFGEHVDDHQLALARRLDAAGMVSLVEDEGLLASAIRAPRAVPSPDRAGALSGPEALSADVRAALAGLGSAPISELAA
jgi:UDP-N-acetylglucosamine transferase subunit ALG13